MSDYRVYAKAAKKKLKQRFYLTIVAANGEPLFHSEMYKDRSYAVELGQKISAELDANFINAT